MLTLGLLAVAGCGGSNNNNGGSSTSGGAASTPATTTAAGTATTGGTAAGGGGGGHNLKLSADKTQLKYDTSTLSASAGKVTITMTNPSALPHDVAITGNGVNVKGKVVTNGGKSIVSTNLKPGTYTFYCSVDAHRQAGMEGKLTVK
jgi:plastocyanin